MNRLTELHNGIWGMSAQAVKDGYDKYSVFSKLAEYENLNEKCIELTGCGLEMLAMKYSEFIDDIARLHAFDSVGLTPEEIKDILSVLSENQDDVDEDGISTWLIYDLLELAKYRQAEERLHKHFRANITLIDMLNHFISHVEAADGESLKGFRILTNKDAESYDRWKAAEEALKGGSL